MTSYRCGGQKRFLRVSHYFVLALSFISLGLAQPTEPIRYGVTVLEFAVTDLSGTAPSNLGRAMASAFGTPLVQSRRFRVLTRAELDKVSEEIAMSVDGLTDLSPDQIKKFGQFGSADILITGDITVYAKDSYSITAKFIDVITAEVSEQITLPATGPQEFPQVAEQFVAQALQRFPLQGQIHAILDDGRVFINLGVNQGITAPDETGILLRQEDVAGKASYTKVGTFTIKEIQPDITLITPQMNTGYVLQPTDLVSIQPFTPPPATETRKQPTPTAAPPEFAPPADGSDIPVLEPGQEETFSRLAQAGGVVRLGEGTFMLNTPLQLNTSVEIIGAGKDLTLLQGYGKEAVLQLGSGSGSFKLSNLTVDYQGADGSDVIWVNAQDVELHDVVIQGGHRVEGDPHGDGLYLFGGTRGHFSNITVRDNDIGGIVVAETAELILERSFIQNNLGSGLLYWDNAGGNARENIIEQNGYRGVEINGGAQPSLENNIIRGNGDNGIFIGDRAQPTINNNDITGNVAYGIGYTHEANPTIGSNHFGDNGSGDTRLVE